MREMICLPRNACIETNYTWPKYFNKEIIKKTKFIERNIFIKNIRHYIKI